MYTGPRLTPPIGGSFAIRVLLIRRQSFTTARNKEAAEASKEALAKSGRFTKPIVTQILPAAEFWPAEDYHQDFYKRIPNTTAIIARVRDGMSLSGKLGDR